MQANLEKQEDLFSTKVSLPLKKHQRQIFPRINRFTAQLLCCNLLKAKYTDFVSLLKSSKTAKEAIVSWKPSKPLSRVIDLYKKRKRTNKHELMS